MQAQLQRNVFGEADEPVAPVVKNLHVWKRPRGQNQQGLNHMGGPWCVQPARFDDEVLDVRP